MALASRWAGASTSAPRQMNDTLCFALVGGGWLPRVVMGTLGHQAINCLFAAKQTISSHYR